MASFSKPIIGLVGRVDYVSDGDCVICIWDEVRKSIVNKGGIPILLLPTQDIPFIEKPPRKIPPLTELEKSDLINSISLCDGIVFSGGYQWYETDEFIYQYAIDNDIPILGICLGMQMMVKMDNHLHEVALDDTILNQTEIDHHQKNKRYVHWVEIQKGSLLGELVTRRKIRVNSRHNYHVEKVNHLRISAIAEDGIIEAVEHPSKRFVLGVQWHPESMLSYDIPSNQIIKAFVEASSLYKRQKRK